MDPSSDELMRKMHEVSQRVLNGTVMTNAQQNRSYSATASVTSSNGTTRSAHQVHRDSGPASSFDFTGTKMKATPHQAAQLEAATASNSRPQTSVQAPISSGPSSRITPDVNPQPTGPSLRGSEEQLAAARSMASSFSKSGGKSCERPFSASSNGQQSWAASAPKSPLGRPIAIPVSRLQPKPQTSGVAVNTSQVGLAPSTPAKATAAPAAPNARVTQHKDKTPIEIEKPANIGSKNGDPGFLGGPVKSSLFADLTNLTRDRLLQAKAKDTEGPMVMQVFLEDEAKKKKENMTPPNSPASRSFNSQATMNGSTSQPVLTTETPAFVSAAPKVTVPKSTRTGTPATSSAASKGTEPKPVPVQTRVSSPFSSAAASNGVLPQPSTNKMPGPAAAAFASARPEITASEDTGDSLSHLRERLEALEKEDKHLQYEVSCLMLEAERRKYLGTDSVKAPYMINVRLPNDEIQLMQAHAQLKVNELCRRVFAQEQIDIRKISHTRVVFGTEQLGHLMMLGEAGVCEGKTLDMSYRMA